MVRHLTSVAKIAELYRALWRIAPVVAVRTGLAQDGVNFLLIEDLFQSSFSVRTQRICARLDAD
jgi:hypothetical protein